MSMVKMTYINIYGADKEPKPVLESLAKLQCFHPDDTATTIVNHTSGLENVYAPLASSAKGILQDIKQNSDSAEYLGTEFEYADARSFLEDCSDKIATLNSRKAEVEAQLATYVQTKAQLYHLTGLTAKMDDIFSVKFLKVRFGRLPKDSYLKLPYYNDKNFTFNTYDFDGEYYWGVYFAPEMTVDEVDKIFATLYFERIWVPDFVHGTPQDALVAILEDETKLKEELADLNSAKDVLSSSDIKRVHDILAWSNYESQIFEMGKYAVSLEFSYFIGGFIPTSDFDLVKNTLEKIEGVTVEEAETQATKDSGIHPPVKIKSGWFGKPFSMFVDMYGLPSYFDIDPTNFIAITYAVLFGIMFGDIGQGALLGIIGYFIMWKKKGMLLGNILVRCSFFSVIFGLIYGSVFGFEEATNGFWQLFGLESQPLHVMKAESTNFILIFSIGCGAFIIITALLLGIISKTKRGSIKNAIFSNNGIAGLIFYVSILLFAVNMLLGVGLPFIGSVPYIILFIAIPVFCMYFGEPLTELINGHKPHGTIGSMITEGFFEMFEIVLSFASNTMSFLRVGAFVLAHAGMMSVVFTLANMSADSPIVYWIIVIIGNIFVMMLEALFVGIQVLRLEFYEMFSRFYEANGTPFAPLKVNFGAQED